MACLPEAWRIAKQVVQIGALADVARHLALFC